MFDKANKSNKMDVTIRNVNGEFWRDFKATAVREGLAVGEAINLALSKFMRETVEKKKMKKHKEIWDLKPVRFKGPDAEHISEKADEILYGAGK